jgi:hypothetical protein
MTMISDYKAQLLQQVQQASGQLDPGAQKMLDVAGSDDQIAALIKRLNDPATPAAEQLGAMNTLDVVSNFSKVLPTQSADLTNALRGLINSPDAEVRRQALSSLSVRGDAVAQQHLRTELASGKPEAERSVPTHQAIAMLGIDEKAIDKSLFLAIAENPPDDESLVEAVRHLPADHETAGLLMDILQDVSKPIAARALIPDIVNNIDSSDFAARAKQMLEAEGAASEIAPFLVRGVANMLPDKNLDQIEDFKTLIRSLAPDSPDSFLKAANPLMSPDKTSSNN